MKVIKRLEIYINYKQLSKNQFDKSIGASNGYIGKQIRNNASIGGDIIEKIASVYTDLNLNWLISGIGEMIQSSYAQGYNIVEERPPPYDKKCKECEEKDKMIEILKEHIETLKQLNETLITKTSAKDNTKHRNAS